MCLVTHNIQNVTNLDERLSVVQVRLQQVDECQADVDGGRLAEAAQEVNSGMYFRLRAMINDNIDPTC